MLKGTVVVCSIPNSFANYLGLVLDCDGDELRVLVNGRSMELQLNRIIEVIGVTSETIDMANNAGRWMQL